MSLARFLLVAVGFLLVPALTRAAGEFSLRISMEDDPRYADPAYDDRSWSVLDPVKVPTRTGPYWIRLRIHVPEPAGAGWESAMITWRPDLGGGAIDSVFLSPALSFELYWDGQLVDRNGVVGSSSATEVAGTLNRLVRLTPAMVQPGEHLIAFRISAYHYNFPTAFTTIRLTMANYEQRLIYEARRPVLPLIGVGGALLVSVVCGIFYLVVDRRRPLLIGAALGVAMAVFYGLISLRWLFNLTYDWHCPRLTLITAVMAVIATMLPWMLLEQFGLGRKRWWFVILGPLLVAAWFSSDVYEVKALWLCRAMLVVSAAAVAWAVWLRRPGAWFVLLGLIAGLLVVRTSRRAFLDPSFFIMFDVLVLFPLATLGLQLRADRRRAQEATLAAARLETELLKKNIQPHFLINTLSTIMETIERDPRSAVQLIEALAAEFRILAGVSGEKLIPLGQELELCRAHLRIMSLRKDAECSLEVDGVDPHTRVPPALFHTLIENGLTHLRPIAGRQRFLLKQEQHGGVIRFTLLAEGAPSRVRAAGAPPREGTGMRYLKARLEESFAGRWTLTSTPRPDGWSTEITIGAGAPAAAVMETRIPVFTPERRTA